MRFNLAIFSSAVVVLLCGLVVNPARSDTICFGEGLRTLWGEASGTYAAGDYEQARPKLLRLAEGGFAPAQLFLGRLLGRDGASRDDLIAAYSWLSLALDGDIDFARGDMTRLEDRLSRPDRDAAQAMKKAWHPVALLCSGGKYRVPKIRASLGVDKPRFLAWWGNVVTSVAPTHPALLSYLMSVKKIEVVDRKGGEGPLAGISRDGSGLHLVLDAKMVTKSSSDAAELIIPRVRVIVNDDMLVNALNAPEETYKGRHLMGWPVGDNQGYLDMTKQAIDMIDSFPPKLKSKFDGMTDFRFYPRQKYDVSLDSVFDAAVVRAEDGSPSNVFMLQFQPAYYSAAQLILSMALGSELAKGKDDADVAANLSKSTICAGFDTQAQVIKVLELDERYSRRLRMQRESWSCF